MLQSPTADSSEFAGFSRLQNSSGKFQTGKSGTVNITSLGLMLCVALETHSFNPISAQETREVH
jgi:hypothetical protein